MKLPARIRPRMLVTSGAFLFVAALASHTRSDQGHFPDDGAVLDSTYLDLKYCTGNSCGNTAAPCLPGTNYYYIEFSAYADFRVIKGGQSYTVVRGANSSVCGPAIISTRFYGVGWGDTGYWRVQRWENNQRKTLISRKFSFIPLPHPDGIEIEGVPSTARLRWSRSGVFTTSQTKYRVYLSTNRSELTEANVWAKGIRRTCTTGQHLPCELSYPYSLRPATRYYWVAWDTTDAEDGWLHPAKPIHTFTTPGSLTINLDGQGTVHASPPLKCGTPRERPVCSGVFASGTTVTLTPRPASGHELKSVEGPCRRSGGNYLATVNGNTPQCTFTFGVKRSSAPASRLSGTPQPTKKRPPSLRR